MTTTYLFGKANQNNTISMQRQATSIIKSFFNKYNALMGKPVFTVKNNKTVVQVFYFTPKDIIHNSSINVLGNTLTRCLECEVELRLIHLNKALLDGSILTQYLSLNSNKYSFNRLFDMLKASLPTVVAKDFINENSTDIASHINGIKVKLSGRLTTQRSGPRQTVNTNQLGSSVKGQYGATDFSQYTSKNKLGAFTIKV